MSTTSGGAYGSSGSNFPTSNLTGPATAYRDALLRRIAALGDAVERPGFSDDVPEALRHVGVMLSSSRREGTHEGLIQGAASGASPRRAQLAVCGALGRCQDDVPGRVGRRDGR